MGDRQTYIHSQPVFVTSNIIYINGSSQVRRECNINRNGVNTDETDD